MKKLFSLIMLTASMAYSASENPGDSTVEKKTQLLALFLTKAQNNLAGTDDSENGELYFTLQSRAQNNPGLEKSIKTFKKNRIKNLLTCIQAIQSSQPDDQEGRVIALAQMAGEYLFLWQDISGELEKSTNPKNEKFYIYAIRHALPKIPHEPEKATANLQTIASFEKAYQFYKKNGLPPITEQVVEES